MGEYKTLKDLLCDATESKGRVFVDRFGEKFEPRFLDEKGWWYGNNLSNSEGDCFMEITKRWKEIKPKTVYYRAYYKYPYSAVSDGFVLVSSSYYKNKEELIKDLRGELIEIEEREFEV